MKELSFQTELVHSAKEMGGYALKLANKFKIGIPDLMVSMPGHGIIIFECKALKEAPGDFDRQTGITGIQREHLLKINASQHCAVAAQLIYIVHRGEQRAIVWPAHLLNINSGYEGDEKTWVARSKRSPKWDIMKLASAVKLTPSTKS